MKNYSAEQFHSIALSVITFVDGFNARVETFEPTDDTPAARIKITFLPGFDVDHYILTERFVNALDKIIPPVYGIEIYS